MGRRTLIFLQASFVLYSNKEKQTPKPTHCLSNLCVCHFTLILFLPKSERMIGGRTPVTHKVALMKGGCSLLLLKNHEGE